MSAIVLVGLMATGKTTVGARLAEHLGRDLVDSDEQIEARTGRTVRDIWLLDGQPTFRALEADALAEALGRNDAPVVAAAGGVVLSALNRERLKKSGSQVVWLRARPETLLARLESSGETHRPLLDDDPAGALERMAEEREDLYAEVATVVVDVDDLTHEQATTAVIEALAAPQDAP